MHWLSVMLPGAVEDALLYAGHLVTMGRDGTLSVLAWGRLVESLGSGDGVVTALLARNDVLEADRAGLLRQALRPALSLLAGRRLESALEPFVVRRLAATPWSDAAFYRRRLYFCGPDGVWSAPFEPDEPGVLGEPRRLSAAPASRVAPSALALAVLDADGLVLRDGAGLERRVAGLAPERIDWHGPNALVAVSSAMGATLVRTGRGRDGQGPVLRGVRALETLADPPDQLFGQDGELWAGAGRTLWRLKLDGRAALAIPHDRIELPLRLGPEIRGTVTAFGAAVESGSDIVWVAPDGVAVEGSSGRTRAFPRSSWYRRLVLVVGGSGGTGIEVRCHLDDLLAEGPAWAAPARRPYARSRR